MELSLVGAALLGLFGGLHCIGMCGGISASLAGALPQPVTVRGTLLAQFGYNVGRIFSYAVAGALAGGLGLSVLALLGPIGTTALRVLAGLFLVAAGLYLSGWWMGMLRVEQLGARAWRHIAPFAKRLGPLDRPWKLVALGAIWGWLPCGLVYAALAGAIAAGGALEGARWMACFGLGTLPTMLAAGAFSNTLVGFVNRGRVRWAVGALVIGFGLWTIAAATLMGHAGEGGHAAHSAIQIPTAIDLARSR
ncbi:MAG: sulfite exporter TauE/SafE family protein [Deltaproteobacteria bacterium]|jgi:sulfite exporter TauE/SafE|nr:sulfite exporter TauE/SafE family protein [Deltaproteobacteria bacterium]